MLSDPTYEQNEVITKQTAILRAKTISNATYSVKLVLPTGDWFQGQVVVQFDLDKDNQQEDPCFLTLEG
jgi:hypothetical protein